MQNITYFYKFTLVFISRLYFPHLSYNIGQKAGNEKMSILKKEQPSIDSLQVPASSLEILRNTIFNELLQEDTDEMMYWLGRSLARQYPLKNLDEVSAFFIDAGFGILEFQKESKKNMEFHLSSKVISYRFAMKEHPSYKLEAGFIAAQMESWTGVSTECYEELVKGKGKDYILLNVIWDPKQPIE